MDSKNNNLCALGGDMLAYLYNEMTEADRDRFDLHLVECDPCTDEFAALSQARYPVYEWKKLEFEPMATPAIVLPAASVSWFDKVKSAFSFSPGFSAATAGFAAILLVAVVGLAWLGLRNIGDDDQIARSADLEPSPSPVRKAEPVVVSKDIDPEDSKTAASASKSESKPDTRDEKASVQDIQPVKASVTKRKRIVSKDAKAATPAKRDSAAPGLTQFADDEDDSLRLAELFNDIDTDRSKL